MERHIIRAIPALNALPPLKDRTRLIIGDALTVACLRGGQPWPNWDLAVTGDSILMGFDPVAFDTVGLQMLSEVGRVSGEYLQTAGRLANPWLARSAELGLGTNDPNNIELVDVDLG